MNCLCDGKGYLDWVSERLERERQKFASLYPTLGNIEHFFVCDLNTIPVADEPWQDYGDMHQEERT